MATGSVGGARARVGQHWLSRGAVRWRPLYAAEYLEVRTELTFSAQPFQTIQGANAASGNVDRVFFGSAALEPVCFFSPPWGALIDLGMGAAAGVAFAYVGQDEAKVGPPQPSFGGLFIGRLRPFPSVAIDGQIRLVDERIYAYDQGDLRGNPVQNTSWVLGLSSGVRVWFRF
jgi:hypothetical protein